MSSRRGRGRLLYGAKPCRAPRRSTAAPATARSGHADAGVGDRLLPAGTPWGLAGSPEGLALHSERPWPRGGRSSLRGQGRSLYGAKPYRAPRRSTAAPATARSGHADAGVGDRILPAGTPWGLAGSPEGLALPSERPRPRRCGRSVRSLRGQGRSLYGAKPYRAPRRSTAAPATARSGHADARVGDRILPAGTPWGLAGSLALHSERPWPRRCGRESHRPQHGPSLRGRGRSLYGAKPYRAPRHSTAAPATAHSGHADARVGDRILPAGTPWGLAGSPEGLALPSERPWPRSVAARATARSISPASAAKAARCSAKPYRAPHRSTAAPATAHWGTPTPALATASCPQGHRGAWRGARRAWRYPASGLGRGGVAARATARSMSPASAAEAARCTVPCPTGLPAAPPPRPPPPARGTPTPPLATASCPHWSPAPAADPPGTR